MCQYYPSSTTPSWSVTAPRLTLNLSLRSQWALGAGRGQAVGADAPEPVGGMGDCPRSLRVQSAEMPGVYTFLVGLPLPLWSVQTTLALPPYSLGQGSRSSLGPGWCLGQDDVTTSLSCGPGAQGWPRAPLHLFQGPDRGGFLQEQIVALGPVTGSVRPSSHHNAGQTLGMRPWSAPCGGSS